MSILCLALGISVAIGKKFEVKNISLLPSDRSATDTETMVKDGNGDICALIKLAFPKVDEAIISGDQIFKKEYHGNEWYIYMPPETFTFYIKYPGYDDLEVDMSNMFPSGVESGKTYKVVIPYDASEIVSINSGFESTFSQDKTNTTDSYTNSKMGASGNTVGYNHATAKIKDPLYKTNDVYLSLGYNPLTISGVYAGLGGYISNVNFEADVLVGMAKSEDVYWNDSNGDAMPLKANYTPMGYGLKCGYGIIVGNRVRLTPRVGIRYMVLSESSDKAIADKANAMNMAIGCKAEFALSKLFTVSLEPDYGFSISKSEGYKVLSDVSRKIKGYSEGMNLNISLNIKF